METIIEEYGETLLIILIALPVMAMLAGILSYVSSF